MGVALMLNSKPLLEMLPHCEDAVREVRPCRRGDLVQQVAGLLLVEVERTRETTLDEAVVKTYVVGSRLLPVDISIVGSWAEHVVILVAELIRRRIRAERVEKGR